MSRRTDRGMLTVTVSLALGMLVGFLAQRWKRRSALRWTIYAAIAVAYISATGQSIMKERNPMAYAHYPAWRMWWRRSPSR
jgi:hypothetical protein